MNLSAPALLRYFGDLVRRDRECTAALLAAIGEIDHRKLWARHACPSMFAFCRERFHMSESMAGKRIWAARAARRFPLILEMVQRGELHLSGIQKLAGHLTEENHAELLGRARHLSVRETEELVAEIAPRPDVPSRVRALPRRAVSDGGSAGRHCTVDVTMGRREPGRAATASGRASLPTPSSDTGYPRQDYNRAGGVVNARGTVRPLAPRRYKLEVTIDQECCDQLRALQDLLARQLPGADPAAIIERAIDLLWKDCLKRKAALTGDKNRSSAKTKNCKKNQKGAARSTRSASRSRSAPAKAADARTNKPGRGEKEAAKKTVSMRKPSAPDPSIADTADAPDTPDTPDTPVTADTPDTRDTTYAHSGSPKTAASRSIPASVRREVWKRDAGRCAFRDDHGRRCRGRRMLEFHHEHPFAMGGPHSAGNVSLRCHGHNQYQADLDFGEQFMRRKRGGG